MAKMHEIDIASFAANLLEEDISKGKPVQFQAAQSPDAPDVSDVEVPHDFASQVLSEGHWEKAHIAVNEELLQESVSVPSSPPIQEVRPQQTRKNPVSLNEDSLYKRHLLKEYKKRVSDLEELVAEMTTVGMLGVGPGPGIPSPSKKKKKVKKKRYVPSSRFNKRS